MSAITVVVCSQPYCWRQYNENLDMITLNYFKHIVQNSGTSPGEMKRLRRERDELQALVEKFEKHLQEVR